MLQPIANTSGIFAECPVWLNGPQLLCWIDCSAGRLFSLEPSSGTVRLILERPGSLFTSLIKLSRDSALLLANDSTFEVALPRGLVRPVRLPDAIDPVLSNDGKVDRSGRIWIGTVRSIDNPESGYLYVIDHAGAKPFASGIAIPNGPAFSLDGDVVYFADSAAGTLLRADLDKAPCEPTTVFKAGEGDGAPDGMTVDSIGRLYVALHGGGDILRLAAGGGSPERLPVPIGRPTSCAFGGADLRTLFVTVAHGAWPDNRRTPGLPAKDSGILPSLFALRMDVPGVAEPDCKVLLP